MRPNFANRPTLRWLLSAIALACTVQAGSPLRGDRFGEPDQLGGYATTHILVRLAAPTNVATLIDGPDGLAPMGLDGGPVDALALQWGVSAIEPLFAGPFANVGLAQHYGLDRTVVLHVPPGTDTLTMAVEFSELAGVDFAEVDGVGGLATTIPNDNLFFRLWNLENTGQVVNTILGLPDADIDAPEAWDISRGSPDVTIAIVDTGVQATHMDMAGKVISGWNTFDNNGNTDDVHGHGTHVAGIAGGIGNNSVGIVGVCWNCSILAMRCFSSSGTGTESQCAAAIRYAADAGADIISLSVQFYTGTNTLRDAVAYAYDLGALPIAATGNNRGNLVAYPARFDKCMAVGATDNTDVWYTASNWGDTIDVSAPGKDVYSSWKGNAFMYQSGSSMAAPHVAGLAGLIRSHNPSLSNDEIEDILKKTAQDLGPLGFDTKYGWGRISAFRALLAAYPVGDLNCDGTVDTFDINGYVMAWTNPERFRQTHPACDPNAADMNGDGVVDAFDVSIFINALSGV